MEEVLCYVLTDYLNYKPYKEEIQEYILVKSADPQSPLPMNNTLVECQVDDQCILESKQIE